MITFLLSTARNCARMCCLAVLFTASVLAGDSSLVGFENRINELVYTASRSVVTVEAIRTNTPGTGTAPGRESVYSLVSSGIIYDTAGHVLVAATSVIDRDRFVVQYDGSVLDARLRGVDYRTGVALLSVGRRIGKPVKVAGRNRCAGQMVIAVGNAYGVRAAPSIGFCAGYRPDGNMQFSAMITSGTIGGGVFDLSGNLVGIIIGGRGEDRWAEVGLALPASELAETVGYLCRHGDRHAGYIGIRIADVDISPGIEIPYPAALVTDGRTPGRIVDQGVMVTGVIPGEPAFKAGLQPGDLLFSINGLAINSAIHLQEVVRSQSPGSRLDIGFIRHDNPYMVQFEVGQLAEEQLRADYLTPPGSLPSPSSESLEREVDSLKEVLRQLERRLKELR